jgi:DNA mismatch repair protein MutL
VVGQVLNIYIVVEKENHLILVDQHAAHERIVFEQLLNRYRRMDVQSQSLAIPEVLELSNKEAVVLESIMADLADLGIRVEPFGGTSFVIKAVPVLVEEKHVGAMVVEMVEKISQANGTGLKDDWLEDALATMACHRSVRGGQSMSVKEMAALVEQLFACENPMHCPHGRPVFVSFDARSLEKLFKRLV